MSDIAIKVESLSKKYWIGKTHSSSFRDTIDSTIRNLVGGKKASRTEFWALRDITCQINQGEAVGIIGRNGAGKSTLLKILSRITVPTKGKVTINGRVSSLLEVGTGFHAELTGRENIYMNGSLLGMKQKEIRKKFDEIVEFSGVQKFIDTPVKHYSSGMYVRLAFAVAAHLEPEILIVDEVLAVGDAEFQKKCLGKMEEVGQQGRTILFVSHSMTAIESFCTKTIYLEGGKVNSIGPTKEIIDNYLSVHSEQKWSKSEEGLSNEYIGSYVFKLKPDSANEIIDVKTAINVEFSFNLKQDINRLNISTHLYNIKGDLVFNIGSEGYKISKGNHTGTFKIPAEFLNDGNYMLDMMIVKDSSAAVFHLTDGLRFEVKDLREVGQWFGPWGGAVRPTFIKVDIK